MQIAPSTAEVLVHTWGALDLTGHSSVEVTCDARDDGKEYRYSQYLSFHPRDRGIFSKIGNATGMSCDGTTSDLEDDRRHQRPTRTVRAKHPGDLDIAGMLSVIEDYRSQPPRYHLYRRNCSTLVVEVLMRGLHRPFQATKSLETLLSTVQPKPPGSHGRAFEAFRESAELYLGVRGHKLLLTALGKRLVPAALIADIASHMFFWTPGDASSIAEGM